MAMLNNQMVSLVMNLWDDTFYTWGELDLITGIRMVDMGISIGLPQASIGWLISWNILALNG